MNRQKVAAALKSLENQLKGGPGSGPRPGVPRGPYSKKPPKEGGVKPSDSSLNSQSETHRSATTPPSTIVEKTRAEIWKEQKTALEKMTFHLEGGVTGLYRGVPQELNKKLEGINKALGTDYGFYRAYDYKYVGFGDAKAQARGHWTHQDMLSGKSKFTLYKTGETVSGSDIAKNIAEFEGLE